MADLANLAARGGKQDQASYRRDSFGPRRQTDAPGLEVNATIGRSNNGSAEQLRQILGLAGETAQAIGDALGRKQAENNKLLSGQAAIDATAGTRDETQYANSKAYRRAYDYENATAGAVSLDSTLTSAVQDRLNNTDDPATLEDITKLVDDTFRGYAVGPDGKARDFGSPEATVAVADQLTKTRARLLTSATGIIRDQTNERTLSTIAGNIIFERTQANEAPLVATGTTPIQPSAVAPAAVIANPFTMAPNGFVASSSLADLFGAQRGVRISSENRSVRHNAEVGGVANSQHIGGDAKHSSAIDMVGITPARAKQLLAENGLTGEVIHHDAGSGMHVHIESVKPLKAVGDPVGLPSAAAPIVPPTRSAPIDFEAYMARVPNTIDRGKAKTYLLGAMIQAADENKDDKLMDGLWQSKRADGTPSFNPTEINLLRDERDRIRDQRRTEADRDRKRKWDDNSDILTTAIVNGAPPSDATLREWVNRGDIDPSFAYSLIQHNEAERKQDAREAKADARQAEAEAKNDMAVQWATEAELRRTGALRGSSYDEDVSRLNRGEFGQGRSAVTIFKQLRAATRTGEQTTLDATRNPDIATYASRIQTKWAPAKRGAGNSVLTRLNGGGQGAPDDYRPGILAEYRRLLKTGEEPGQAYIGAVAKMGPKDNKSVTEARAIRIRNLQARATEGR